MLPSSPPARRPLRAENLTLLRAHPGHVTAAVCQYGREGKALSWGGVRRADRRAARRLLDGARVPSAPRHLARRRCLHERGFSVGVEPRD